MDTPWNGLRVLVVDDADGVRHTLAGQWRALGLEVVGEARNGVEALEKISEVKPDLISLDIIMPEMDGIECLRLLRKNHPQIRVILVTALASESRVVESYEGEIAASQFVEKPTTTESLTKALKALLDPPLLGESGDISGASDIPLPN